MLGEDHPDTAASYNNLAAQPAGPGQVCRGRAAVPHRPGDHRGGCWARTTPTRPPATPTWPRTCTPRASTPRPRRLLIPAARSFEHARLAISFTGLDRATFAAERSPLPLLAALQARRGQATEAWAHLEAYLARGLLDDLSARRGRPLDDQERRHEQDLLGRLQRLDKQLAALAPGPHEDATRRPLQDRLGRDRDAVLAELTALERDLTAKYGPAAGQTYDLATIQAHLPPDAALVAWLDLGALPRAAEPGGMHWACLVRARGQPAWVALTGSGPQRAWTDDDDRLPARVYMPRSSRRPPTPPPPGGT